MTLSFNVFGLEVARIRLDIERDANPQAVTVVDKGAKFISREFFRRMIR